ncbi:hypothetical protein [Alterisphingorhabdus coralli]|uniref:Uncharacterized protein n=1 Tax=Alterisphingorhabdus coralli TaxID=3071408 RepID=A0AA97F6I6_9SPHN|nr:hypothetical protein [Parasphingorhabdus sp. SCSIO 66989]WOE75314.1 hypothetical protein RB602_00950 [Parasphingorhabdus sp. SCSIO 66989]
MIFGVTAEKVIGRINKLIDELGQYDLRIQKYEQEADLALRAGFAGIGEDLEIQEWRAAHDEFYLILVDARTGIKEGTLNYIEINKQLSSMKKAIRNFKRVLDQTDHSRGKALAAARKRNGLYNAKNQ